MVAVTGDALLFVALNEAILPVPPLPKPIEGVLFVQLNIVLATPPPKMTGAVAAPLHNDWLAGWFTLVVGCTVMVKVFCSVELQASADRPTVIVAVTGTVPLLTAVKEDILPVPLLAKPIDGLLFVQL